MFDYRNSEEGKYPPPEERYHPNYPKADELGVYGVDLPVPETEEDLRCPYNIPEWLELKDLEGYKIPPLGYVKVLASGAGTVRMESGSYPYYYPPGTFLENKVTIGKELGPTHAEITIARSAARKEALAQGAIEAIEELGLAVLDNIKEKDAQSIKELMKQTIIMAVQTKNARELLNATKYIDKRFEDADGVDERHSKKTAAMTPEQADEWMAKFKKWREEGFDLNVIDGEVEDI